MNIGHIRENTDIVQTLEEHLLGTAELCESFTRECGLENVGTLIGLLHDLGKACEVFNQYISNPDSNIVRGEIDHSTAGAQYLSRFAGPGKNTVEKIALEIMKLAILSHHSGLINCISSEGEPDFDKRLIKNPDKTHLDEAIGRIDSSILDRINVLFEPGVDSLSRSIRKIYSQSEKCERTFYFRVGLLTRLVLSALIDADRIDTIRFQCSSDYTPITVSWLKLQNRFEERLQQFDNSSEISKIRSKISDDCFRSSARDKGVFTLTVPTGGGKTLSSFRFALNHVRVHNMKRIIYVIPYLSILEQNAEVIRDMINSESEPDYLTECHSNVDVGTESFDNEDSWRSPIDSWDGPIIFTSMVQFLEALFASGTKRIRRMHNLANSVIVFDEIQTLPIKTVYMFNEAINFLCDNCGSTAVLCTATQPCLNESSLKHPLLVPPSSEIIGNVGELFGELKRTQVTYINPTGSPYNSESMAEFAIQSLQTSNSVLVIVNTKKMAHEIYEAVHKQNISGLKLYHLSTNMCPAHRRKKLKEIMHSFDGEKLLCVSTQLIEAGIDIDFETVVRGLAGLDSIAQAAGRCNRHAKRACGNVFVLRTDETLSSLKDIKEGRSCSELILRPDVDPLLPQTLKEYYQYYFFKRESEMDYPVKGSKPLFELLSTNNNGKLTCINRYGSESILKSTLSQAFKDANELFHVIDSTDTVVVPYNEEAREAISDLCSLQFDTYKQALRTLQQYSVNTFNLDRMMKSGMVKELICGEDRIYCLIEGYYDEELGIVEYSKPSVMML